MARSSNTSAPTTRPSPLRQLTASRDTSDGFMPDRNYSSNASPRETWLNLLKPGATDILLAASDRPYGANQFYGPYDCLGAHQGLVRRSSSSSAQRTSASYAYRRHTDLFVLLLDNPDYYRNNHATTG